jgi:hypothetical protein
VLERSLGRWQGQLTLEVAITTEHGAGRRVAEW